MVGVGSERATGTQRVQVLAGGPDLGQVDVAKVVLDCPELGPVGEGVLAVGHHVLDVPVLKLAHLHALVGSADAEHLDKPRLDRVNGLAVLGFDIDPDVEVRRAQFVEGGPDGMLLMKRP